MSAAIRTTRAALFPVALLAVLAVIGCDKKANNGANADSSAADSTAPSGPQVSDAEIAHIALTANSIDSAAGEAALQKASNAQVKDFAQTMIRDHGAANQMAVDLATRLSLTPQDNDQSRGLKSAAEQSQAQLNGLSGAAYDRAYIDHEVVYHQGVLDALDHLLIPQTDNAELKALLEQIRPNVAQHLQRAQQIRNSLTTAT